FEVAPRTLRRFEKSPHHLSRGIIDSSDQTKPWPSALKPVMRRTVNLQHHSFSGSSFPAASVLNPPSLSRGSDTVSPKELTQLLSTKRNLLFTAKLLGQMVIIETFVLAPG